ncbi:MAG: hypothetical protein R3C19_26540 [Planctomycetaceae bacterium]
MKGIDSSGGGGEGGGGRDGGGGGKAKRFPTLMAPLSTGFMPVEARLVS